MRRLHAVILALAVLTGCGGDEPAAPGSAAATGSTASASSGAGASGGGGAGTGGGGGAGGSAASAPKLGIAGDAFTLDGVPTFLLGVSYFDGKNWHAEDLDGLAQRKFNLIRVWLDWTSSFYDPAGPLASADELVALAKACGERGIVLDATLLDTDLTVTAPDAAVRSAVAALAAEPNVLFDLVNEHDHAGNTFSHEDVAALAVSA